MKFAELKCIFAEEQTAQGLLVIGLDANSRQVEVLFQVTGAPKVDWEAINIKYLAE